MDKLIEVRNLYKKYNGNIVINNLSFSIKRGDVVGLIGPNGAGKTTTLNILTGLESATSGYVLVNNKSISNNELKQEILFGALLEPLSFPKNFRVFEYLKYRAQLKASDSTNPRIAAEHVMKICNIPYKLKYSKISNLSRGIQQKIAIAEAFLCSPNCIILDEPTANFDIQEHLNFRKLVNTLKGTTTFIISSHHLHELEAICDYFIILNKGKLIASGSLDELKQKFFDVNYINVTVRATSKNISYFKNIYNNIEIVNTQEVKQNLFSLKIKTEKLTYNQILKDIVNYNQWQIITISSNNYQLEDIFNEHKIK